MMDLNEGGNYALRFNAARQEVLDLTAERDKLRGLLEECKKAVSSLRAHLAEEGEEKGVRDCLELLNEIKSLSEPQDGVKG